MKKYLVSAAIVLITYSALAQVPYNAAAPNGYTKKAEISEQVGLTNISISYHRPKVNGREGKIWGQIVHNGFIDQGFGARNPAPWRAGANENTVISIESDIKVEGQMLHKGKYGLFVAYDSIESIIIFSKRTDAWGSFYYDSKEDALRVMVKPEVIDKSVEYLKYEFVNQTPNAAFITLSWEKKSITFKVEVDLLKQQFQTFVQESQNPQGFTSQGLTIAANWCLQNNYELDKALQWATLASGTNFPGDPTSFAALTTKANILDKLGKSEDAASVIKNALQFGNMGQLQQLGRQLIAAKKPKLALDIYEFSHKKNPDQFITIAGMARGLSANGEYVKALEFANKALLIAPNDASREAVKAMIEKLKSSKDIN